MTAVKFKEYSLWCVYIIPIKKIICITIPLSKITNNHHCTHSNITLMTIRLIFNDKFIALLVSYVIISHTTK